MSKPQIDAIEAESYRQLTVQDVVERLNRQTIADVRVNEPVVHLSPKRSKPSAGVDLTKIPEHLF